MWNVLDIQNQRSTLNNYTVEKSYEPIERFLLGYITFSFIDNFRITLNANIVTIATFYWHAIHCCVSVSYCYFTAALDTESYC